MEWWQAILLYLGIWIFGFFTGTQAGLSVAVARIGRAVPPSPKAATAAELQQLLTALGQSKGVSA